MQLLARRISGKSAGAETQDSSGQCVVIASVQGNQGNARQPRIFDSVRHYITIDYLIR